MAFVVIVLAIMITFVNSADPATRQRLLDFLELLVAFVVGGTAAGTAGWHRGYAKGARVL